jgi:hypothetical protein
MTNSFSRCLVSVIVVECLPHPPDLVDNGNDSMCWMLLPPPADATASDRRERRDCVIDNGDDRGCPASATPIRSAWMSKLKTVDPVIFLQSNAFAIFDGGTINFMRRLDEVFIAVMILCVML